MNKSSLLNLATKIYLNASINRSLLKVMTSNEQNKHIKFPVISKSLCDKCEANVDNFPLSKDYPFEDMSMICHDMPGHEHILWLNYVDHNDQETL